MRCPAVVFRPLACALLLLARPPGLLPRGLDGKRGILPIRAYAPVGSRAAVRRLCGASSDCGGLSVAWDVLSSAASPAASSTTWSLVAFSAVQKKVPPLASWFDAAAVGVVPVGVVPAGVVPAGVVPCGGVCRHQRQLVRLTAAGKCTCFTGRGSYWVWGHSFLGVLGSATRCQFCLRRFSHRSLPAAAALAAGLASRDSLLTGLHQQKLHTHDCIHQRHMAPLLWRACHLSSRSSSPGRANCLP